MEGMGVEMMPMSAEVQGLPLPSITRPLRIRKSYCGACAKAQKENSKRKANNTVSDFMGGHNSISPHILIPLLPAHYFFENNRLIENAPPPLIRTALSASRTSSRFRIKYF